MSFAPDLARDVREDAAGNVSAWLADAARRKARRLRAAELLRKVEAEDGPITDAELKNARGAWPG